MRRTLFHCTPLLLNRGKYFCVLYGIHEFARFFVCLRQRITCPFHIIFVIWIRCIRGDSVNVSLRLFDLTLGILQYLFDKILVGKQSELI